MRQASIIAFPGNRKKSKKGKGRCRLNAGKKGRVYSRGGRLWVDFYYLGRRVRERSGLEDTAANRVALRRKLDLIVAEVENCLFEFAKRFPHSNKKDYFTLLEGRTVRKDPEDVLFADYVKKWWKDMRGGMSDNQIRDYTCVLRNHLLPYFGAMAFSEIRPVLVKKFVATLKVKQNRYGEPLSTKTIRTYLVPLRVIVRDARDEFGWDDLRNPFFGIRLSRPRRLRIQPLNYAEWSFVMAHTFPWYRPYFEFAVQTGLRPSEQVALKWSAIDDEFVHVELSRVRGVEKAELKTAGSFRRIELRPNMRQTLKRQRELTAKFEQPYVFLNSEGRPIQQENLGRIWRKALLKGAVAHRRMYEIRHTFASWALAAGESPEWVARTLGHVDTTMVYRIYGRYIPNLTRKDGSAFERQYNKAVSSSNGSDGHNLGHNRGKTSNPGRITDCDYRKCDWSGRLDLKQSVGLFNKR